MEAVTRASPPRPILAPERLRVTSAQYHRMAEAGIFEGLRVQLIEGEVIVMPPMGGPHAYPIQEMNTVLVKALPEGYRVRPQLPVALDDENEPEPDFAIVEVGAGEAGENPQMVLLAIEIADSSLAFDLNRKQKLYARFGIPEYWVLDVNARVLVMHRSPGATKYRSIKTLTDLSKVSSVTVKGLVVDLRRVFVRGR
jgi:Uma2 family endonuclease